MLGLLLVLGAIPQVGPELLLDSPLHGPAAGRQADTAIAMDSAGGLAVWVDSRTGSDQLFGTRLDASGGVIDQRGVLIAAGLGGRKPRLALIGSSAYVVFMSTGGGASQVYGVKVDRTTGVASAPLRLSTLATDCNSVDVITEGGNAWVFWGQNPTAFRAVVSMTSGLVSTVALGASPGPVAASTSTVSGLATVAFPDPQNPANLNLGSVDFAGTLTPTRVVSGSMSTALRVGVTASSTFIAAQLADGTLTATRLGPSTVSTIVVAANVNSIDLDCLPSVCGYEWSTVNGQLGLSLWDSMSAGLTPAALTSIGLARDVSLSHLPTGWISAFSSNALGTTNVFLTATGVSASLLSVGANAQRLPTVSWDGQEFLVDLLDHSFAGVGSNVFTARVTTDGGTAGSSVLLPNGFESVALTPWSNGRIAEITVASFESQATNLWANPSTPLPDLDAGFVMFPGAVGARPRLAMQPSGSIGALCWNASGVNVALMTIAGVSTMPLKLSNTSLSGQCEVAVTNTGYLVVWREVSTNTTTLRAMRFTASLVPIDVDGGVVIPTGATPSTPAIASTASTAVIAWSQNPGATTLAAAKFDLLTGSLSTIPMPTKAGDSAPALTWTGNEMIVAYQSLDDAGMSDVFGVSIDPFAPSPSSSAVYALATSADPEITPALASDRNGTVLLAYGRYDSAAAVHDQMVRLRVLKLPTVTPCNNPGDCPVGKFCADGVCCDTACGNSNPNDCQACTVAAGGLADGTCTLSTPNWMCAPASMCNPASFCSGQLSSCPAPVNGCDAGVDAGSADAGSDAGSPDAAIDAGAPDAAVDAGAFDAGVDAGTPDAAVDAGAPDAAVDAGDVDAGTDDAGSDAGAGDAGTVTRDAGTTDAAVLDAGATDAGQDPAPVLRHLTLGCGCSTSDSSTLILAVLALLTARAKHRKTKSN